MKTIDRKAVLKYVVDEHQFGELDGFAVSEHATFADARQIADQRPCGFVRTVRAVYTDGTWAQLDTRGEPVAILCS